MPKPTLPCLDVFGNVHEVPREQLFWRPSAYGIILRDDEILLCRQHDKLNLPGGGLNFGESIEDGLLREVREETGLIVGRPRLVGVDSNLYFPQYGHPPFQSIMMYYLVEEAGGQLSTDGFDEDEQDYAELPVWVKLSRLEAAAATELTSTNDYRTFVRIADKLRAQRAK